MRTIWKGAISFGLVHIPVKLYPATENKDIKFNYLHEKCKTPVKYKRYCPTCNVDVPPEEIVRGYEYEDGKYVVLTEEELDNIPLETAKTIGILDFVNLSEVDPVYFEKSYYLVPNEGGEKAFDLLKQAMDKTKKTAISKIALRSKESLAAIRVSDNKIMMTTMYFPDEIRSTEGLPELNYKVNIHENELKMAVSLVNSLSESFQPQKYTDEYRKALMELIQSKITGDKIEIPEKREAGNVIDLMEALKASIKIAEEDKNDAGAAKKAGIGSEKKTGTE